MTQSDLASREVTISYVSRIESGQRRPDGRVLVGLADRLGVSVDDLLGGAGEADAGETVDATRLALDYVELTLELGDANEALLGE